MKQFFGCLRMMICGRPVSNNERGGSMSARYFAVLAIGIVADFFLLGSSSLLSLAYPVFCIVAILSFLIAVGLPKNNCALSLWPLGHKTRSSYMLLLSVAVVIIIFLFLCFNPVVVAFGILLFSFDPNYFWSLFLPESPGMALSAYTAVFLAAYFVYTVGVVLLSLRWG